jgi:hypothetical protein
MGLLRKCDANDHLSASRNMSRRSFWPTVRTDKANPPEIKPDKLRTSKLTFIEDFTLEHSLSGRQFAPIEISGIF